MHKQRPHLAPNTAHLEPGHRLVAQEVAEAFSESVGAGEAEAYAHRMTGYVVGQHLADRGHPGRWDQIDIRRLFNQLCEEELEDTAFFLSWMLVFLAREGELAVARVDSYLDDLAEHGPQTPTLLNNYELLRDQLPVFN